MPQALGRSTRNVAPTPPLRGGRTICAYSPLCLPYSGELTRLVPVLGGVAMAVRQEEIRKRLSTMSALDRSRLMQLAAPRIVEPYVQHIPHPAQQVYLSLDVREALYGGAAGGGKSDALLMAALQYVDVPGYAALLLRRTWPDLVLPGAIMDRTKQWLSGTDARPHDGGRSWTFPSGAKLQFGYLASDDDKYRYQSAEFQFVGFDELTQWPNEATYDYLFSRIRRPQISCMNCKEALRKYVSSKTGLRAFKHTTQKGIKRCGRPYPDPKVLAQYPAAPDGRTVFDVPLRMRAATNPGGRGAHWVKTRLVDPRTKRPGSVFVPARLADNPSLDAETYRENLEHLNPIDRERLLNGDWDITEGGDMFERVDFKPVDGRAPADAKRVRFWDMAASDGDGSDYTVGTLCAVFEDKFWIEDVVRAQKKPHECEKLVLSTALRDGINVHIRMEEEGGSSGKAIISSYKRHVLSGFNFDGIRPTGTKTARASALASYAKKDGLVLMCIAEWNRLFLDELEVFPNGGHDDQVDSVSSGFNYLMFGRKRVRLLV